MDDADRADMQTEEMLQRRIRYISQHQTLVQATGICLNCETPLIDGKRFCDYDCMTDWSKRNAR